MDVLKNAHFLRKVVPFGGVFEGNTCDIAPSTSLCDGSLAPPTKCLRVNV